MSQTWLQLLLLALLVSVMLIRHGLRMRRVRREREDAGQAFDATTLQRRIHDLRANHVAAVRTRTPTASAREQVTAAIRQTIRRLAYFSDRQPDATATDAPPEFPPRQ